MRDYEGLNEGLKAVIKNGGVNEVEDQLLSLIHKHPGRKPQFFQSEMNIPKRTIERWLQKLRLENKIAYRGRPKRGGGYFITHQGD